MSIPPIIVLKNRGAGSPGIYVLKNGVSLEQIGDDFGSLETFAVGNVAPDNRGCIFNGKKYTILQDDIREENQGGAGTWGVVHTLTQSVGSGLSGYFSGLHVVQRNGIPTLTMVYQNLSGHLRAARSADGTTWANTGSLTGSIGSTISGTSVVYKNRIYWWINGSTYEVAEYDPASDSAILYNFSSMGGGSVPNADFAVHDNRLFLIHSNGPSTGNVYELREFIGGTFALIHTFTGINMGGNGERGKACLFSDGTDLIAICIGADNDTGFRIQNPGLAGQTVTNVTTPMIPAEFRFGGAAVSLNARYWSFINNHTSGSTPEFYLFRLYGNEGNVPGQTGGYTLLQYTDTTTEMAVLGEGPDADIAIATNKSGGSERIVGTTQNIYAEIQDGTIASGNVVTFNYKVYGSGSNVTGTLYYNESEEIATTTGTITLASGGSSSASAGTIINITPDSGATLYSATWDASGDGVVPSSVNINLRLA